MLPRTRIRLINTLQPYFIYNRILGLIPFNFIWQGSKLHLLGDVKATLAKIIFINAAFSFTYMNTLRSHLKEYSIIESLLESWISLSTLLITNILTTISWIYKTSIRSVFQKMLVTDAELEYAYISNNKWVHCFIVIHVLKCSVLCSRYIKEANNVFYSLSLMLCLYIESSAYLLHSIPIILLTKRFKFLNLKLSLIKYGHKCEKDVLDGLRNIRRSHALLVSLVHEFNSCFQRQVCLRLMMLFLTTIFMLFNIYERVFFGTSRDIWIFAYAVAFDFSEIVVLGVSGDHLSQEVNPKYL